MASKRMFSNTVVSSDYFLDMSPNAQLLYFHVCMNADDDGFCAKVNSIARLIGVGPEAVDELVDHSFLIRFEDKACVVKHWRVSNQIRSNIKHRTEFRDDLEKLYVKDNGIYTTDPAKGKPVIPENERVHKEAQSKFLQQNAENCGKNAAEDRLVQVRLVQDSTGKYRLGKNSLVKDREVNTTLPIQFVNEDGVPEEGGNEMEKYSTKNIKDLIVKNLNLREDEKQRYFDFVDELDKYYAVSEITMVAKLFFQKVGKFPSDKQKESFFDEMEYALEAMSEAEARGEYL